MPVKKPVKKEKSVPATKEKKEVKSKYFSSVGRRKKAIARVRLFETSSKKEAEAIVINEKPMKEYLTLSDLQEIVEAPLRATNTSDKFALKILVKGGGIRGQAEAIQLGVARALVKFSEDFRKTLRDLEYLTRDARVVERKKAGLRKARRAPQFSKR